MNASTTSQRCALFPLAAIMLCMASASYGGQILFSDGDFSANWSTTKGSVGTGSTAGQRMATGGNPGLFWQVTNTVVTDDIHSATVRSDFTYTPVNGAFIQDVSFAFDAITLINNQGQGVAPVVFQGGVYYGVFPQDSGYYSAWTHINFATLTSSAFTALNGSGTHPNFAAGAPAIQFGFVDSNTGTGIFANRTTIADFDNFAVTIDTVPEPAGLACLAVAGFAGCARRRHAARR